MADLTHLFGGRPLTLADIPPAPVERHIAPPDTQLRDAMLRAGLSPPSQLELDGRLHRFRTGDDRNGDKSGWYVAYTDGIPAGTFGCWRAGLERTWRADVGRTISPAEEAAHARQLAQARAARDAALERQHAEAAEAVTAIWENAMPAPANHPYLIKKAIPPHGARVLSDGRLVLPLYNERGLSSLQYITGGGEKRFHPGGLVSGCYWCIGDLSASDATRPVFEAEGYATAVTIYETTRRPCFVAYSAPNLPAATGAVRNLCGPAQLVIVADNDLSGTGERYAKKAADAHGARLIMPPIVGMDANDYLQAGHDLAALLETPSGEYVEKLRVVFGNEIGDDFEAPDELIENLLTLKSLTVLYGDSNSGKTFFALSLAAAVATGSPCYGRQVDPGLVIYLASESPGSIRSRMQAIKKFYGCDLEKLAMVPVPLNFYSNGNDAADVVGLVSEISAARGEPVKLIIGDTLARMSAGANENSGEDMGPVMARFEGVAQATGAAIVIIHHTGKDAAKGSRGWSGIRAHIETEIEVMEKDGDRSAVITKQRELPGKGESIPFKLEILKLGISKFGGDATTCVAVPDKAGRDDEMPAMTKKDSKLSGHRVLWEKAWWSAGAELRDGVPYLSRSGLKEQMRADGTAERTITNALTPSRVDGVIGALLQADMINPIDQGWIMTASQHAAAMTLVKTGMAKK